MPHEFSYGSHTSAHRGGQNGDFIDMYLEKCSFHISIQNIEYGFTFLLMIVDVMWNILYTHMTTKCFKTRINIFIILNWKLLLGEKFIFQFSRYVFFIPPTFCLRFFLFVFYIFSVQAYVQKRRKMLLNNVKITGWNIKGEI